MTTSSFRCCPCTRQVLPDCMRTDNAASSFHHAGAVYFSGDKASSASIQSERSGPSKYSMMTYKKVGLTSTSQAGEKQKALCKRQTPVRT